MASVSSAFQCNSYSVGLLNARTVISVSEATGDIGVILVTSCWTFHNSESPLSSLTSLKTKYTINNVQAHTLTPYPHAQPTISYLLHSRYIPSQWTPTSPSCPHLGSPRGDNRLQPKRVLSLGPQFNWSRKIGPVPLRKSTSDTRIRVPVCPKEDYGGLPLSSLRCTSLTKNVFLISRLANDKFVIRTAHNL